MSEHIGRFLWVTMIHFTRSEESTSHLFPIRILFTLVEAFCFICVIQFRMSIQETVQSNTLNHTVQANAWPTLKRVIIGHVIHHQNTHGSTIIRYQVVMSGQSSLLRVSPVVMVRKRSWPAVSHICNLMRFPFRLIVLTLKSMLQETVITIV